MCGFSSFRNYCPVSDAVGSGRACDATAIEVAEAQLTAENKGLEIMLPAIVVSVEVNVSVACTIAVAVALIVTVMYLLCTHAMAAVIAFDNVHKKQAKAGICPPRVVQYHVLTGFRYHLPSKGFWHHLSPAVACVQGIATIFKDDVFSSYYFGSR